MHGIHVEITELYAVRQTFNAKTCRALICDLENGFRNESSEFDLWRCIINSRKAYYDYIICILFAIRQCATRASTLITQKHPHKEKKTAPKGKPKKGNMCANPRQHVFHSTLINCDGTEAQP